jgi:alkylation response protein AidB-like acyl-CoA dehydrogenase
MFSFEMSAEQHELKNLAKKFAAEEIIPVAPQFDAEEKFPETVCRQAWELGLMNLEVPKELAQLHSPFPGKSGVPARFPNDFKGRKPKHAM